MCSFVIGDRTCKIPSKDDLCHIHMKSSKLAKKVKDQAVEITILNKRLSEATRKLYIIDQLDRIKYELAPYAKKRSFRQAIADLTLKDNIELIFDAPQSECIGIYDSLLTKRNILTHRYTSRDWVDSFKKTRHSICLKKLCKSVKSYDLLR